MIVPSRGSVVAFRPSKGPWLAPKDSTVVCSVDWVLWELGAEDTAAAWATPWVTEVVMVVILEIVAPKLAR